jgi:hypothetical protein
MQAKADTVVWIYSECRFKKPLLGTVWFSLFSEHAALYHKSPRHTVVESGAIAFRLNAFGKDLLDVVIDTFCSGDFRKEEHWDDGYIFHKAFERHPELPSRNLAVAVMTFD